MSKVEQYGLSRRRYISINDYGEVSLNNDCNKNVTNQCKGSDKNNHNPSDNSCKEHNKYKHRMAKKSYGGNQEWFPKDGEKKTDSFIHGFGCGVIALTDLFLYWAFTLPNGKETFAGQYINERNEIIKEDYMVLVEEIRKRYAPILGSAGTFAPELTLAINRYAKDNHIEHRAILDMSLDGLEMLRKIKEMLKNDQPIILMIGHSFPLILSRFRKKGIPFYKRTRILDPLGRKPHSPYARYQVMKKSIFGHFVMITGIIIDEQAEYASQNIMLRISSWGTEYYISYQHLRQYMTQISRTYLSGMISLR